MTQIFPTDIFKCFAQLFLCFTKTLFMFDLGSDILLHFVSFVDSAWWCLPSTFSSSNKLACTETRCSWAIDCSERAQNDVKERTYGSQSEIYFLGSVIWWVWITALCLFGSDTLFIYFLFVCLFGWLSCSSFCNSTANLN